jgi:hypothetical protein
MLANTQQVFRSGIHIANVLIGAEGEYCRFQRVQHHIFCGYVMYFFALHHTGSQWGDGSELSWMNLKQKAHQ